VVLVFLRPLCVHLPGVPLAAERWDGIHAPVDEDAECGLLIPIGHLVFLQRFVIGAERAFAVYLFHLLQNSVAH